MKGSGGILLIGIAVVLIAASVTGRLDAVWQALRGATGGGNGKGNGETDSDNEDNPDFPDNTSSKGLCCPNPNDEWLVQITGTGQWRCFNQGVISTRVGETCPAPEVNSPGTTHNGDPVCVDPKRAKAAKECSNQGQAGFGMYNLVQLPTGFSAFRYAPNVR